MSIIRTILYFRVQTVDGRVYDEELTVSGQDFTVRVREGERVAGYVVDTKPDLQVR